MAAFQREEFERLCFHLREETVSDVCISNLRYGTLTEEMLAKLLSASTSLKRLQFNVALSISMLLTLASWLNEGRSLDYLGLEYCDEAAIYFLRTVGHVSVDTIQFSFFANFAINNVDEVVVR